MGNTLNYVIPQNDSTQQTQSSTSKASTKKTGEVGKDEFLQLLVTQLKYQDPLKPMDDKEFIGQMAQFSALEQMQNLNTSFNATRGLNLVGKYIEGKITNGDTETEVKGDVESVKISGSNIFAVVNNQDVAIEDIYTIKERSDLQKVIDISKYTGLIGKDVKNIVKGLGDDEIYEISGNVQSVSSIGDQAIVLLNNVQAQVEELELSAEENEKLTTIKDYLQNNIGKVISAVVTDSSSRQTKITGKIVSVSGDENAPNVVFDEVASTIDSIYQISQR